ncbi:MAG: aminodeoxychorismate/anthranilate synthase component II [Fimbriimonadaceae bacterium]|nr:aminodeoxychorismate/anthranilate synthase component II [Fimbriimonadaceae bacterium]
MILVVDNYDSFTYNLVQYVGECGEEVVVRRNDAVTVAEIATMSLTGILLSPGPCTPRESGVCLPLLDEAHRGSAGALGGLPIFGVCLGLQAMGHTAGGEVARAKQIMHGKPSLIRHGGQGVFAGIPSPFSAIRYHSLSVRPESLPSTYEVTATAEDDGEIMGLAHRSLPIEGVQFHPESVLTEHGMAMIANFVKRCQGQSP